MTYKYLINKTLGNLPHGLRVIAPVVHLDPDLSGTRSSGDDVEAVQPVDVVAIKLLVLIKKSLSGV